jgi:hypothetical protein
MMILEANVSNIKDLTDDINKVLNRKDIPQFEGSEKNIIRSWFSTHYLNAIKNDKIKSLDSSLKKHTYKDGEPEWMKKSDIMDYSGSLPEDVVDEISHIVDYFESLDVRDLSKIKKQPYETIQQKVKDWSEELAASVGDTKAEDNLKKSLVLNKDYKIVMNVDNFKWVKLLTSESRKVEGDVMGHCVGGDNYENKDIYSLWDNKSRSHVTIESDDSKKQIFQIKGKSNASPADKYQSPTIEFIAQLMLKGYKVKGDGENIGMVEYDEEYYFDDLDILPEKYRTNQMFRKWSDVIYPTVVFPKQQKAIEDLRKRIVIVNA